MGDFFLGVLAEVCLHGRHLFLVSRDVSRVFFLAFGLKPICLADTGLFFIPSQSVRSGYFVF